jgi:hypothetical protein
MLKKIALVSALLLTSALGITAARAGSKVSSPINITVYSWGTYVSGNPADARASSDPYQRISCAVNTYSDGFERGFCQATNSQNVTVSCYVNRPEMIQSIYGMGPTTYIAFNFPAGATDCANITIENGSRYRPVQP